MLFFLALLLALRAYAPIAAAQQDRIFLQVGIVDVDLSRSRPIVRTRCIHAGIVMYDVGHVRGYLFFRDQNDNPDFLYVNTTFREKEMDQHWAQSIETIPERGQSPRRWYPVQQGIFPCETYELNFLLALDAKAKFGQPNVSPYLDEALQTYWEANYTFRSFPADATEGELRSVQVDPEQQWRRALSQGCRDFYHIKIELSRPRAHKIRFTLHWALAIMLLIPIGAVIRRLRSLELRNILTVCLAIAFFAVPNLMSLQTYLPKGQVEYIEYLYFIETFAAILIAGFAILGRPQNRPPS